MKAQTLNELIGFETIPNKGIDLANLTQDNFEFEDLFGEEPEEVFYFKGDVILDGTVLLNSADEYGMYIIDGDLTIKGSLILSIWDIYHVLLVKGNLVVENLFLDAEAFLIVKKECNVSGLIVNNLSDGGGFFLHKNLSYKAAVQTGSGEVSLKDEELIEEYNELIADEMSFEQRYEAVLRGEKIYY